MKKKLVLHEEIVYLAANIILALSVAIIAASDFGVSMVVANPYILSLKFPQITFGQAEYICQGLVFTALCIILKKIKPVFFTSFLTCIFYGFVLDMWRALVPILNPEVTAPGSFSMPVRIAMFAVGEILTAFSVALFFEIYLYPQVIDFSVKMLSKHFKLDLNKFKIAFDISLLSLAVVISLILFGGFKGIGVGTVVISFINGFIIGFFRKIINKFVDFKPLFPKLKAKFEEE